MRYAVLICFFWTAAFALANPIVTLTLDSSVGYGAPAGTPDPDSCLSSDCVLFSGTITDLGDPDTDTPGVYYSYTLVGLPYTAGSPDFDNELTLDTYFSPPGLMSGDPASATDGNPQNIYYGPIFAVDIPAGTPNGVYTDIVNIDFENLDTGNITTLSQTVTVVIPEPGGAGLLLAGLLPFAAGRGARCKRRSSEASQ